MISHTVVGAPVTDSGNKIHEAYGLRKAPKLLEQIQSQTEAIRNNALDAACVELANPTVTASFLAAPGAVETLVKCCKHEDVQTRRRGSKVIGRLL